MTQDQRSTPHLTLKPLNEDRDPVRWAKEFMAVLARGAEMDEGFLIAWFANAMMCGEDTYRWRTASEREEIVLLRRACDAALNERKEG